MEACDYLKPLSTEHYTHYHIVIYFSIAYLNYFVSDCLHNIWETPLEKIAISKNACSNADTDKQPAAPKKQNSITTRPTVKTEIVKSPEIPARQSFDHVTAFATFSADKQLKGVKRSAEELMSSVPEIKKERFS